MMNKDEYNIQPLKAGSLWFSKI